MGTSLIPYESETLAKNFAKQMKKPIAASMFMQLSGEYEKLISDDVFTDALYEDANAFYLKSGRQYESFDVRPVLKERMSYFMIDEELQYLLTGKFLDPKTSIKAINIVRAAIGLSPLKKITQKQMDEYTARLLPDKVKDEKTRHALAKHPEKLQSVYFKK